MGNFDKKVDAYIAKSAPFAKEILEHLREIVHKACPEVEETIKWGFPHFEYKGILCSMAAFKAHCAFGFWKGAIMQDPKKVMTIIGKTSMGSFDRITSIGDLPSEKIMIAYIKEAKTLNENDIKLPDRAKSKTVSFETPEYFLKALKKNKKASETFQAFSNSNKKDYVEWITEAKTESTREKRMETSIKWIAEGKIRNWKYIKKK
jgi:uncharacterized protein YdeI (YjbR/CyaY-like superfamily)